MALMLFGAILFSDLLFTRYYLTWGQIIVLTSLLFFGGLLLILDVMDFSFIDTAIMKYTQILENPDSQSASQNVSVFKVTAISGFQSYLFILGIIFPFIFLLVYSFHIFGEKVIHDIKLKQKINQKLKTIQIKKDKFITYPICQKIILKPKATITLLLKSNDYIQPNDLKKSDLEAIFKCRVEGIGQEPETHLLSITLKTSDLENIIQD